MMTRFFLLTFALSLFASAQNKDDPRRHIRVIALGERPVNPGVKKGNIIVIPEPKPGQLPPKSASIRTSKSGKSLLPLKLNTISNFVSLEPEVGNFEMWGDEAAKGAPLLKGRAPGAKQSLAVLYRDPKNMTWFSPKILVLKDDRKTFPANHIRFVNVSELIVYIQVGRTKPFGVAPGSSKIVPLPAKANEWTANIQAKSRNGVVPLHNTTIPHEKGHRTNCFFYKPQGKKAGTSALKTWVGEKIPALPKPPKKE